MVRKIPTLALSAALFMSGSSLAVPVGVDSAGMASPSINTPLTARSPMFPRTPHTPRTATLISRDLFPRDSGGISRCGNHPSAERLAKAERHFRSHRRPASAFKTADPPAPLNVNFHVIYANETLAGGYVPDEQLNAQVDVLNKAYNSTGISWKLANVTRTRNENWFLKAGPDGEEEQTQMKTALRTGEAFDLNVYTVGFNEGSGKGLLGYATFPIDYAAKPKDDGVVMKFSTLPNGTMPKGHTLTHESGHWSGLLHTFESGCSGDGDSVDDTVPEKSAASGCPINRSTCPGGRPDPIHNFMDYSDDSCMVGFTPGQGTRIQEQMRTYRHMQI
ncbi:hypothetical protein C8J56DRAFT_911535 [Mycena floridula]|nr:hypothetical protein C8J56DRAFT_911535 [Mycena floridula]